MVPGFCGALTVVAQGRHSLFRAKCPLTCYGAKANGRPYETYVLHAQGM